MAACSCGGYGEPKVEGHFLGCASWDAPSLKSRLTVEQKKQRAEILGGAYRKRAAELLAEAEGLLRAADQD